MQAAGDTVVEYHRGTARLAARASPLAFLKPILSCCQNLTPGGFAGIVSGCLAGVASTQSANLGTLFAARATISLFSAVLSSISSSDGSLGSCGTS